MFVWLFHFAWEMGQSELFASMQGRSFWDATATCFGASLVDVLITAVAFFVAAAVTRAFDWPVTKMLPGAVMFVVTGLLIAIAYEIWAMSTDRWSYDSRMPTVLGIGLSPLLQWLVLPVIEIAILRWPWRVSERSAS